MALPNLGLRNFGLISKFQEKKKTKQFISELTKERAVEFYLICMF